MKNVTNYSPTVAELQSIAEKAKKVTIKGIDDEKGIEKAKETRKELVKLRNKIIKQQRAFTSDLREQVKKVNEKGKELVSIIEPEELRIKELEAKVKEEQMLEERKILLPTRKKMLESIKVKMNDNEILLMDETQFSERYTELQNEYEEEQAREKARKEEILLAKKNAREAEKKRKELELLEAKLKGFNQLVNSFITLEQFDNYKWEKEDNEKLEKAKQDSFASAKAILKNKLEEDKKRKEAEIERKKLEAERLKNKRLKNEKYQKWLKDNNFSEKTMVLKQTDTEIIMYKIISKFKK